jgi:hypothetical protein
MSNRGVDGTANHRMLRLGSMAATISYLRAGQPLWRNIRAPRGALALLRRLKTANKLPLLQNVYDV